MDDPWGSPWASADSPSDNDPPPSGRANNFLSPPPKAFFGNATSPSAQSPWSNHDGNGLGIWSTADRADGADNHNGWSAWADSGIQPPRLSPRLSVSGRDSPLPWPENVAASPVLIGNSRSRTPSILRHHSPDPWATELSFTSRSNIEQPNSARPTTTDTPAIETAPVEEPSQTPLNSTENGTRINTNTDISFTKGFDPGQDRMARENDLPDIGHDLADEHVDIRPRVDVAVHEPPSRSSTCTVDTRDGPERQDSPITSIDEDRGARVQVSSRKPSGKVQELVGVYNGLTRAASEEPPTFGRLGTPRAASRDRSPGRGDVDDDDRVGFGDFEDGSENNGRVPLSSDEVTHSLDFPSTLGPELEDEPTGETRSEETRPVEEEERVTVTKTIPNQPESTTRRSWNISFDTNSALVDKLFPDFAASPTCSPAESWGVPDHVTSDSFATISERKAWYRISRYGSMRRHNSGDDENYHSVTWPTSHLRRDTIKIVRRWMEEDSYAGRATLGGIKRTGFFDWDSDAAPVELGEVFRRKKPAIQHTRAVSIPANNTVLQTTSMNERPYRNSIGIPPPTDIPSASQTSIPTLRSSSDAKTRDILSTHSSYQVIQGQDPARATAQAQTRHPAPTQTTPMGEDDDDWGDMVSSPCITEVGAELGVSTPMTSTNANGTTQQHSLAPISDLDEFVDAKPGSFQKIGPTVPDPWRVSDLSILDKPEHKVILPEEHAPQADNEFAVPGLNTSSPSRNSLAALNKKTISGGKIPDENKAVNQPVVKKASVEIVPPKRIAGPSDPINSTDESKDDIIVQKILQSLPDLSYMLR